MTSSAPSSAATTTSRPVLKPPSTRSRTRPRRPFATSACCVSASPSSHGTPAFLIEESGLAPVPPSAPAMWTTSASAFATPAATTPTPASATSFTEIVRVGVHLAQVEDRAARGPRSSRCRGAAAARSARRRAACAAGARSRSVTLCAGIWPPSPGFEPCAILIWSSSAKAAYSAVTPKRPDATCLIFELRSVAVARRVLAALAASSSGAPSRLSAIAIVSCASAESAPCDIAPPEKRRTIDSTGSTSSSGTGSAGRDELEQVARLHRRAAVDERRRSARRGRAARRFTAFASACAAVTASWSASTTSGSVACGSPPLRNLSSRGSRAAASPPRRLEARERLALELGRARSPPIAERRAGEEALDEPSGRARSPRRAGRRGSSRRRRCPSWTSP